MSTKPLDLQAKNFWHKNDTKITLSILILIFIFYSVFIAFNIDRGIIPDEITHFDFSKQFSTTLGIPPELPEAYKYGVYITQSPFLFYWINGRIINIANLIFPSLSDWQMLVTLRILNVLYTLGTIVFCYLLSKEFIKHKWWQLLPVFFLTNTLMFVFLSGGVNYDNLANLFCFAGLFYLARVFNHHPFVTNSLSWMIFIALGSLTKYTVLPLALAMGVAWLIYLIKNRKQILPFEFQGRKNLTLFALLISLIFGNIAIYGHNLIVYHALLPNCEDILSEEECRLDYYNLRMEKFGLEKKLTLVESIKLGYPNPLEYLSRWIIGYISAIFGINSHRSFKTKPRTFFHLLLLIWIFYVSIRSYINKFKNLSFMGVFLFYLFTIFITNYNSDLYFGFKYFGQNGRYFFQVIGILFIALTKGIMKIPHKMVQKITLIFALLLYFFTGPLTFIYRYNAVFSDWFVR